MGNLICKKVISLLAMYIENKLDAEDRFFVENHFLNCPSCYQKYLEMKKIINNLHFEYEKLLSEFEKIEADKIFNIREYEIFYKNISPYIDDELNYDESVQFRRYLLKSKSARSELANAYNLKNNIKHSVILFKDSLNINFPKKIIKRLQTENKEPFELVYKKATIVLSFMISTLIIIAIYISFAYLQDTFTSSANAKEIEMIEFPIDKDWIEFTFDKHGQTLLSDK